MKKTFRVASGHTMFVKGIDRSELPPTINKHAESYTTFYVVKNWDDHGVVFMYLAKGQADAKDQVVAFYGKTGEKFWSSYGLNLKSAIEGAQADGWMYH